MTAVAQRNPPASGRRLDAPSGLGSDAFFRQRADVPAALRSLMAVLPAAALALLLLSGIVLAWRRLAGAFDQALPAPALCVTGIVIAVVSEALRRHLRAKQARERDGARQPGIQPACAYGSPGSWFTCLPVLAAWLAAAAIALPDSSPVALIGLWGSLLVSGGSAIWQERLRSHVRVEARGSRVATEDEATIDTAADEDAAGLPPDDVIQRFERRQEPDGGEWITGLVRLTFAPGQKMAHAHVAFCPPFLSVPFCEAETVSGPDGQLKVAQLLPQGARFDLRLDAPQAEPVSVVIEFAAHWKSASQ